MIPYELIPGGGVISFPILGAVADDARASVSYELFLIFLKEVIGEPEKISLVGFYDGSYFH
ncbi:hypothetical protein ES703_89787 [subsurface metagenome]